MAENEIAIVGAGCRFPGADNLEEFWQVLVNGENHVTDIPESRWNNAAFYYEDKTVPGKSYVRKAGLLKNHDAWDNRLFGISDVEASRIDPQQRYVLECVHMALEDGGITRKHISGTKTGVIIGCMNDDYKVLAQDDIADVGNYNATGTATSVISARVSYVYNLHGTCLTLDTACSSALVAIHLACQAIKTGDCDMVICGGVSSILSPGVFVALCKARMMSATGQCQSFCDTADGYARGEGCGIVILKGLEAAIEDGNKIWGTIKTGSNHDGCTTKPMTAPSGVQQLELLKQVYHQYRSNPSDVQYIEAHGTGTPIGDPTELNAIGEFFSPYRTERRLLVGSVKSNIGHTESAAGIAGLLKVLLMMKHGKYVPSLHVKHDKSNINKTILLDKYNIDIATSVEEWPCDMTGERHACLNSFGFGGSNTHAIVTQKKTPKVLLKRHEVQAKTIPVSISGFDESSLKINLSQFCKDLEDGLFNLEDVAFTSFNHRDIHPTRTLVFGKDKFDIIENCNKKIEHINKVHISPKKTHNKIFVYCGVGTTWTGMCQEMMQQNETFRKTINQIDSHLKVLTGWKIGEKFLTDTDYSDPYLNHIAIFCVQVAQTEVWKSFGVSPDTTVGQSVGEVAAAYAANLLSLSEAVKIIHHRSEVLSRQSEGSMTVIGNFDVKQVEKMCARHDGSVCMAVYSSPVACTISGSKQNVNQLAHEIQQTKGKQNVFIRELKVNCAYHSSLLNSCIKEVKSRIDTSLVDSSHRICNDRNSIPMISTVTGKPLTQTEATCGRYWAENIRQPVLFMQSIKKAFDDDSCNIFVEIGPRPVLRAHISNIFGSSNQPLTIPSMTTKKEIKCFYGSLAEVVELGVDIRLPMTDGIQKNQVTRIPRYVFARKENLFFPSTVIHTLAGFETGKDGSHMFVQTSKRSNDRDFLVCIDEISTPFVYDHFISDRIIVPGATYAETGFHVGAELFNVPVDKMTVAISFVKTFTPSIGRQHKLKVQLDSKGTKLVNFSILNDKDVLSTGIVSKRNTPCREPLDIDDLKDLCPVYKTKSDSYDALKAFNFRYGDSLSLINKSWVSDTTSKCLTEIHLPDSLCAELIKTHLHPAIIDSMFQIFGILVKKSVVGDGTFTVPKGVASVVSNKPVETVMYGYGEEIYSTASTRHFNAVLLSKDGVVLAEMENFYIQILTNDTVVSKNQLKYTLNWFEVQESWTPTYPGPGRVIVTSNAPQTEWLLEFGKAVTILHTNETEIDAILNETSINTVFLFHVAGEYNDYASNKGKRVFDNVLENFFKLKKILTLLKQRKLDMPVAIITENTQNCPERHTVNYEGSELWGMIRSAVHESFYNGVKLVDVDKNKIDIPTVLALLARPVESENGLEYALSGTKLYQPKLQADSRDVKSKRRIAVTTSERLAIYNDNPVEIEQPYLMLTNETEVNPDTLSVALKSITVHNKSLYLPALYDIKQIDLTLQAQGSEDCQIIALEGRGTIEHTNRDVFFLYPVNAETTINIPKKFIIEEKDCPVYMSGILILTNILVHIASVIKGSTSVMVLKQTEVTDVGQTLFISIMKRMSCKTQFCTNKQLQTKKTYSHIQTLIILTKMSVGKLKKVLRSFTNLTNIVSLSMLFPEYLKLWLIHRYPSLQITVLSTIELLSAKGIEATMPVIKDCLQVFRPGSISETSSFLIQLPMKQVSILEQLQDGSLECFCDKLNIFRPQACYIVVGGLTGLGWELLQVMAKMGARILITLSRREPSSAIKDKIVQFEKTHPCRVVPMQADVSDINSVENVFLQILRQFPHHPIKGIFHGAGILDDSLLQNLDEGKITDVIKPKVLGVWNLHSASLNLPIDYFVVHSSVVSVIGNAGQSHYAAANSFLDSFALYRRSKGLPAQSINWGALSVGMAAESDDVKSQLERKGIRSIEKNMIWDLFLEALANDATNIIYADIEWETILSKSTFIKQASKYSNLHSENLRVSHSKNHKHFDIEGFRKLDLTHQTAEIKAVIMEMIHEVFVTENDSLLDGTSLSYIGIDSMSAMSLSNAIDDTFGCRISIVTLLSGETTLISLTENVIQDLNKSPEVKNGSHQTETDEIQEFQDYFKSENITFMQMDFLEKYKQNRENPHFLFVVDIELINVSFARVEWNRILKHVLTINPELRKRYMFSKNGEVSVEKGTGDCEQNVAIVSVGDFSQEKSRSSDPRISLSTDIHNSPLISFKIADIDKNTLLRLIIHAVAIDMRGLSILCKDIELTCLSVNKGTDLPSPRPVIDICNAVRRAIMPRMTDLANFWDKYLNFGIKPVTLGQKLQTIDPKYCKIVNVDVPHEKVNATQKYLSVLGISLYEFIMSLYQLYLFIGSNSPLIPVGTAADMRFHVPELNHVITRCVNYIPVIAHIDEKCTIKKFIEENSIKLSNATRNGAFPSSLIVNKLHAVEVKDNVFRHFLSMNDLKSVNKIQEENTTVQVRNVWIARPDRETFIYVRYDLTRASLQFEMGHNTEICSHYGDKFADILLQLMDEAIHFGSKSIGKVRDEIIGVQERCDTNRLPNADGIGGVGTTVFQSTVMNDKSKTQIQNAQEKPCITTEDYYSGSKMKSRCSKKEMLMKTSVIGNEKGESEKKDNIITDIFEKQTTRGWDHTVEVTLNVVNENRFLLEWGKERRIRKKTHRKLDLKSVKGVVMTKINGLSCLIVDTDDRRLIFKTPYLPQAYRWMRVLQLAFNRMVQIN